MFATVNFNLLMSMAITVGCFASKAFAASVVAGAVGVFIACVIVLMRGNPSAPLNTVFRRTRTLLPF